MLIPESTPEQGISSFLLEKGLGVLPGLAILYIAHFLAFKLFKRDQSVE
jgi:hypothetical protein